MMKTLFSTIIVTVSFVTNAYVKDIQPPLDTDVFIYGVGSDSVYEQAKQAAFADVSQKLYSKNQVDTELHIVKENHHVSDKTVFRTRSKTIPIQFPRVDIIQSEQVDNRWWVVIKIDRTQLSQSLLNQVHESAEELSWMMEEFIDAPGPACWFELSNTSTDQSNLSGLIGAYLGNGGSEDQVQEAKSTVASFAKLFKKCQKRNLYRLNIVGDSNAKLTASLREQLQGSKIQLTNRKSRTGEVRIVLTMSTDVAFSQYYANYEANISLLDEHGSVLQQQTITSRGVSFSNTAGAQAMAQKQLLENVKTQLLGT
ncbi:hypothetical protein [Thalassotalea maritima]|uniref:hypothetical protein n=1 Tax=Thalassotalea maritima TaxID=3242416 RepID=UPI0035288963